MIAYPAAALAHKLTELGYCQFDASGPDGNVALENTQDACPWTISTFASPTRFPDGPGQHETQVQVRFRGDVGHNATVMEMMMLVRQELLNQANVRWADGTNYATRVIVAVPGEPYSMGLDASGRPEWALRVLVRYQPWAE